MAPLADVAVELVVAAITASVVATTALLVALSGLIGATRGLLRQHELLVARAVTAPAQLSLDDEIDAQSTTP